MDGNVIHGPDNYKYKIINPVAGRAESFAVVAIRVANLERAKEYWVGLLGLQEFSIPTGLESEYPSTIVGFAGEQTKLQLIEVQDGNPVDHALSSGRIAFACKAVPPIFEAVTAASETVQTPPLTLPTPGKADVVVTILVDRDGYEICFVEDIGFYDLATPKYDIVDFPERATRGGDGAPAPGALDTVGSGEITELTDVDEVASKLEEAGEKAVILDFNAGWCKNCELRINFGIWSFLFGGLRQPSLTLACRFVLFCRQEDCSAHRTVGSHACWQGQCLLSEHRG